MPKAPPTHDRRRHSPQNPRRHHGHLSHGDTQPSAHGVLRRSPLAPVLQSRCTRRVRPTNGIGPARGRRLSGTARGRLYRFTRVYGEASVRGLGVQHVPAVDGRAQWGGAVADESVEGGGEQEAEAVGALTNWRSARFHKKVCTSQCICFLCTRCATTRALLPVNRRHGPLRLARENSVPALLVLAESVCAALL